MSIQFSVIILCVSYCIVSSAPIPGSVYPFKIQAKQLYSYLSGARPLDQDSAPTTRISVATNMKQTMTPIANNTKEKRGVLLQGPVCELTNGKRNPTCLVENAHKEARHHSAQANKSSKP